MARNTGDPIIVYDNPSIAKYGVQANALGWPHKDLHLVNDEDVHRLVRSVLARQKEDFIGVSSIDLDADQDREHLYGTMSALASRGLGNTARLHLHWYHANGSDFLQDLRAIGFHGVITMEGKQAKFTMQVRTAANQGPTISAQPWTTATDYAEGDIVEGSDANIYQCTSAHTSGSSTHPITGGSYATVWLLVSS